MFRVATAREGFRTELGEDLLATRLIQAFAGLAVAIAAIGLYAVLSRTVAERRREVGIRAALGATPSDVTRLLTKDIAVALVVGLALGAGAAAGLARFVESRLFGVSPLDVPSFAGAAVLVATVLALSAAPACARALRLNLAMALKD